MQIQHLTFIDSVSFLPMPLRKIPEAPELSVTKSWYPHLFNTQANHNYVGPIPDMSQFGADEIGESERKEFLDGTIRRKTKSLITDTCLNSTARMKLSCDKHVRYFVATLLNSGMLMSCTIASACNKVLRKRFLKPETIGLIPAGGCSCNQKYSKKAVMWYYTWKRWTAVR